MDSSAAKRTNTNKEVFKDKPFVLLYQLGTLKLIPSIFTSPSLTFIAYQVNFYEFILLTSPNA